MYVNKVSINYYGSRKKTRALPLRKIRMRAAYITLYRDII